MLRGAPLSSFTGVVVPPQVPPNPDMRPAVLTATLRSGSTAPLTGADAPTGTIAGFIGPDLCGPMATPDLLPRRDRGRLAHRR